MFLKSSYTAKYSIIFMLIIGILFFNTNDLSAKKKKKKSHKIQRHYNKVANRKMSMDLLRQNAQLADLANLQPMDSSFYDVSVDENNQIIGEYGEDLAELQAEDNYEYNAENFQMLWMSVSDDEYTMAGISKTEILSKAMDLFGTPYRFGGVTNRGIDCSAFTRLVYYQVAKIEMPRTAREQINLGKKVKRMEELEFGDLIFFHTYSRKFASHVGIYLGDGLFMHSGTRYGVAVASLNSEYYKKRFISGQRLTEKDIEKYKVDGQEDINSFKAAL